MSNMPVDRRSFCMGAGLVVIATASSVRRFAGVARSRRCLFAMDVVELFISLHGTPLALVAAGILAANPHDTQPWIFHVDDDRIAVYADLSRNLGAMDALLREMHLGLGCAIQNMLLAAPANGYSVELRPFRDRCWRSLRARASCRRRRCI